MAEGLTTKVRFDDREFRRMMRRAQGLDFRPAFEATGSHMIESIHQTFEKQGRPQRWKPLSAVTLYQRAGGTVGRVFKQRGGLKKGSEKKILGAKILMRTGRLLRSFTYRTTSDEVEVGTKLPYAAIHHFGGMAGRGKKVKIPARPYAQILTGDRLAIYDIFTNFMKRELKT